MLTYDWVEMHLHVFCWVHKIGKVCSVHPPIVNRNVESQTCSSSDVCVKSPTRGISCAVELLHVVATSCVYMPNILTPNVQLYPIVIELC